MLLEPLLSKTMAEFHCSVWEEEMGSNYMVALVNNPKPVYSNYSAINLPEKKNKADFGATGLSVWDREYLSLCIAFCLR